MKIIPETQKTKNAIALPSERCTDDVNNQAELRVKNFPGNPEKKNALALPSERGTDDVNNQAEYRQKKKRG